MRTPRYVGLALSWMPLASLAMIALAVWGDTGWRDEVSAVVAALAIGVGLASGACAVLLWRCPGCRTKLLWTAMREQSHDRWLSWLRSLDHCPRCGVPLEER